MRIWAGASATAADIYFCDGDVDAASCIATPDQSTLGVALTIPGASNDWVDIVFDSPIPVTSGQQYTIAVQPNNNWTFQFDSSNPYAGGTYYQSGVAQSGDLRFKILGEEITGYGLSIIKWN